MVLTWLAYFWYPMINQYELCCAGYEHFFYIRPVEGSVSCVNIQESGVELKS